MHHPIVSDWLANLRSGFHRGPAPDVNRRGDRFGPLGVLLDGHYSKWIEVGSSLHACEVDGVQYTVGIPEELRLELGMHDVFGRLRLMPKHHPHSIQQCGALGMTHTAIANWIEQHAPLLFEGYSR
jgi:hypothetical protein